MNAFKAIVIGASAGGVQALLEIFSQLQAPYAVPIFVVLHVPAERDNALVSILGSRSALSVKEAEDKETPVAGVIYIAPADYHLLIENNGDLALSNEEAVNFSRPSIDRLFDSAADAFGPALLAILLTGANDDGARGLASIAASGGTVLIEDPLLAYASAMPEAGIRLCPTGRVMSRQAIVDQLRAVECA